MVLEKKNSKANSIDSENIFRRGDVTPEKLLHWIRSHIQPSPDVNIYSVFENPEDEKSNWYVVVEVPQGQIAYMAKDNRFYKRVGNIIQPMEQYEVVDVMNRTKAAALDVMLGLGQVKSSREGWLRLRLSFSVTSTNYVASEGGGIRFTFAYPLNLDDRLTRQVFKSNIDYTGIDIIGETEKPKAQSIMIRWGAHLGSIIFPGDWYNFGRAKLLLECPSLSAINNPIYLIEVRLFTINSMSKMYLFAIGQEEPTSDLIIFPIEQSNYEQAIAQFWSTFHKARELFRN